MLNIGFYILVYKEAMHQHKKIFCICVNLQYFKFVKLIPIEIKFVILIGIERVILKNVFFKAEYHL